MRENKERDRTLASLAEEALRELILDRKLSPGDLIKLLSSEKNEGAAALSRDFVIRLFREEA